MATLTPVLGLSKPVVGADDDIWGNMWNANADILDTLVQPAALAAYLPKAGGTMTGPIVLAGNAAAALNPVTLQQLTTTVGAYLPLAGGVMTGAVTLAGDSKAVTPSPGDNDTSIATTAFVAAAMAAAGGSVTIAATPPPVTDRGLWWDSTGGQLYVGFADVNSTAWVAATNPPGSASSYLPIAGGIMTGPITLAGNATLPLHAAAFQQIPLASSTNPAMNGAVAVGTGTTWARADHVHAVDTSRVAKTGDTMSGSLSIGTTGGQQIVLYGASGSYRGLIAQTGGSARWTLIMANTAAESGGSVGSDFNINRYTDVGGFIDTPFSIIRSTGSVNIGQATGGMLTVGHNGALGVNNVAGLCYDPASGGVTECVNSQCWYWNRNAGNGGVLAFGHTGIVCGNISVANASSTSYNTSSDARLKEDARPLDAGPILDALRVYDFAWIKDGKRAVGVIAQEAQETFPDAVTFDEPNDFWGVDYSKFVPLLLAEVKALRARVATLEGTS